MLLHPLLDQLSALGLNGCRAALEAQHMEEGLLERDQSWFAGSRIGVAGLLAAGILVLTACSRADKLPTPPATSESPSSAPATERVVGPLSPADAQALSTMNDRLRQYVDLHAKIERSLPKLPKGATP